MPAVSAPVVVADSFLISPGKSIGPVSLGIPVQSSFAALGPSKGTQKYQDGSVQYRWFEPPLNSGLGIAATQNDMILRVWVLNDEKYTTREGLHAGSTEAQVRAILGEPTRTVVNAQAKVKTLFYESIGLWFGIQLNQDFAFYNQVFNIGVMQKK